MHPDGGVASIDPIPRFRVKSVRDATRRRLVQEKGRGEVGEVGRGRGRGGVGVGLITRIRLPIYYPINVGSSFLVNSTGTLPLKFLPTSDLHLLVYAIQSRRIVANFDSPAALVNVDRRWPTLPMARNFVKSTDSGLTSPNFLEQPMKHDLYAFTGRTLALVMVPVVGGGDGYGGGNGGSDGDGDGVAAVAAAAAAADDGDASGEVLGEERNETIKRIPLWKLKDIVKY
ncbi:LOW QUALITY PROTEIN: hypothetical protein V1478_001360 [Vespula squamosa]|uniref:Uncharacterized protein n=1 Tax=Vespula squamosa TaxID=30214 RepID=A0ABD2C1Z8_VESSQ